MVVLYISELDKFWVVSEYEQSAQNTSEHARAFRDMIDTWGVELVFVDSAAAQFSADLAYLYDIATTRAKKDVLAGIGYVQTLVEQGRLLVDPGCTRVLEMLQQYRWDSRETLQRERPLHDQYSHMADALRYAVYTFQL